jgi:hypothetical protein
VVGRNQLNGPGYTHTDPKTGALAVSEAEAVRSMIRGDMRRLEEDVRDERHLQEFAEVAGITPEQVKKVLDHFFRGTNGYPGH